MVDWDKKISLQLGLVVLVVVFVCDQAIKFFARNLVLGEEITLIPGVLWFTHATNTGIAFGLFQDNNVLWLWAAVMIFGVFLYFYDEFDSLLSSIAFFLVLAGLFGNLADRILHGHVIDMFSLGWFPIFNLADAAITTAVILLIINELLLFIQKKK